MHWILDTFTISEDFPGRPGTFHGTANPAMIRPGIWPYSKSLQLDGTTNYLSFSSSLDPCFADITQCPKGFSASLWVRVPDLSTDAMFISNMMTAVSKGRGFSVGLVSGLVVCEVRYSTQRTTIATHIIPAVWVHVGVTWRSDLGVRNKIDIDKRY